MCEINEDLEEYLNEDINKKLRFLTKSEIRLNLLSELNFEPQTIKELVENTGTNYSTVSNNIKKLRDEGFVKKDEKIFKINGMAKIYLDSLLEFKKTLDVIENFDQLWYNHNINGIDEFSIRSITNLYKSQLIETTPLDIYKTHNLIKRQMITSINMKAIFPYVHPDYPKLIENILQRDGNTELILNEDIYDGIMTKVNTKIRRSSIKNGNLKVYITKKQINIYLSILDENMNLGLFRSDGTYDQNRILTSNNPQSIEWAETLFEEFKNMVV